MATEILKSFGTLQSELEQAKSSLKGVDESIKRLIGRDPSDIAPRALTLKRTLQRRPPFDLSGNDADVTIKRRGSVFKRLSEKTKDYDEEVEMKVGPQLQMISKIIVTPKEVPSRQEALAAQNNDEKSKARNRRMFGALLGTLQKFQQEETKLKPKEEKRAQLERKIEEHEIREKAEIKKERQELFFNRKKKQAEIRMIELKMTRMKEYSLWEERQKPRMNFIVTKAKPHICYLPRKLNEKNKADLDECRKEIEKMIDKKRQDVFEDLQQIEERMKKNFEKKGKDQKQSTQEEADEEKHHDRMSEDEEAETQNRSNEEAKENINLDTGENGNQEILEHVEEVDEQKVQKDEETEEKENGTCTESCNKDEIMDTATMTNDD